MQALYSLNFSGKPLEVQPAAPRHVTPPRPLQRQRVASPSESPAKVTVSQAPTPVADGTFTVHLWGQGIDSFQEVSLLVKPTTRSEQILGVIQTKSGLRRENI
jgi:hypothetical protein